MIFGALLLRVLNWQYDGNKQGFYSLKDSLYVKVCFGYSRALCLKGTYFRWRNEGYVKENVTAIRMQANKYNQFNWSGDLSIQTHWEDKSRLAVLAPFIIVGKLRDLKMLNLCWTAGVVFITCRGSVLRYNITTAEMQSPYGDIHSLRSSLQVLKMKVCGVKTHLYTLPSVICLGREMYS